MLNLEEYRILYPQYNDMTDYEFSNAVHRAKFADMPYENFARQVGGPLEEDKVEMAVRQYNAINPNNPITSEDIRQKDRSGFIGGLRLLGEGIFNAITDRLLEDLARVYRGGNIGPDKRGLADDIIAQQRKDQNARIPSLQEVQGDGWANSLYQGPQSVATSMATGLGGMALGSAAGSVIPGVGNVVGGMIGAGAMTLPAFYRMAKDQFVEEIQKAYEYKTGQKLTAEQAERLNAAIDEDASEFGFWEAAPEAAAQVLTAGLLGGAGGAFLKSIGLGGMGAAIGKRAITRIPAKAAIDVAGEEGTEYTTFIKQEDKRKQYGLRDTDPTLGEFVDEQAGAVAVGSLLQMGVGGAGRMAHDRIMRRFEIDRANADESQQPNGPELAALPPGGEGPLALPKGQNIEMGWDGTGLGPIAPEAGLFNAWEQMNELFNPKPKPEPQFDLTGEMAQGLYSAWNMYFDSRRPPQPKPARELTQEERQGLFNAWDMYYHPAPSTGEMLNTGQTVDLLELPEGGTERGALPPGSGAMEMGSRATGRGAIAPPSDFSGGVVATPYSPRPGLPAGNGAPTSIGQWSGGRSQLSYPFGSAANRPAGGLMTRPQQPTQIAAPAAMPGQGAINNFQQAPRADTQAQADQLGMPAPEAMPQEAAPIQQAQPIAMPQAPQLAGGLSLNRPQLPIGQNGLANLPVAQETSFANAQDNTGGYVYDGQIGQPGLAGLQQGDFGANAGSIAGDAAGRAGGSPGESGGQIAAQESEGRNRRKLKIPNRPDEDVSLELMEADDVEASHLPEAGFEKNPRYQLENERRYHDEPASQADVLEHAQQLDPGLLMESPGAENGAPIIDNSRNVLGGNSRAMSIRHAYDRFPQRAEAYRKALKENAERLGIDPAQVDRLKKPMLVRRLEREMDGRERQALVSALNDTFTKSKDKRASGKSRGDRLSSRTLDALGQGLQDADSLRSYFDEKSSRGVVEMLVADGVIQPAERNAFIGDDGLLNPDGKKIVEEALRGRIASNYESLDALPAAVIGKIDAAIPYVLIAENIGRKWNITPHMREAIDLMAEYQASGAKTPGLFMNQANMMKAGKTPAERYSRKAQSLFLMMLEANKGEFRQAFEKYASQAKLSRGDGLGVGLDSEVAFDESFENKLRGELIGMLPEEERHDARRKMTNQQIRDRLKELQREKRNKPARENEKAASENRPLTEEEIRQGLPLVAKIETGIIHKTDTMGVVEAAQKWIEENVPGPVSTLIGEVEVDARGMKDSMSHGFSGPKVDAIPAIAPTLEKGAYLGNLKDKNGKPIDNHYFAARAQIGNEENVVFVRARKAAGTGNRFYVHEVYTEEEIKEAANTRGVTDQDRPFQGVAAFYRNLIANYLKVKAEKESNQQPHQKDYGTIDKPSEKRAPEKTPLTEEEIRKGLPLVAELKANLFTASNISEAKRKAYEWFENNIGESQSVTREPGQIIFNVRGLRNSVSHTFNQDKLDAIPSILPVLKDGVYLKDLDDLQDKPIKNHYFAGRVKIGGNERVVFVRTRQAAGRSNFFYVHEVYTEDEIKKSLGNEEGPRKKPVPFIPRDFYRDLIANYIKVNTENGSPGSAGTLSADQTYDDGQSSSIKPGIEDNITPHTSELKRDYGTIDNPNTVALGEHFFERFVSGKRYDNIGQARREAGQLLHGKNVIPPAQNKAIDESIELGVVKAARKTIADMRKAGKNDIEIFRAMVDLYQRQPNLSSRTSESVQQQAYSTPAPIAFLASRLAGINEETTVYEPTAGNGMLLIEASSDKTTANELNMARAERLRSQGLSVSQENAVDYSPDGKVDRVIENPPFGRVWDSDRKNTIEMEVDGFATKELDQAIVAKSLKALKENGRAVLIIGGKQGPEATRKQKYKASADFWRYLSQNYTILDHFSIDGKLYSRQGASYPIDVIVLDNQGSTEGYVFPGGKPPRVYSSFEQLEELLNGEMDSGRVSPGDTAAGGGRRAGGEHGAASGPVGGIPAEDVSGGNRSGVERGREPGKSDGHGENNAESSPGQRTGELERPGGNSPGSAGQTERGDRGHASGRGASEQNNDVADLEGRDVSTESENGGRSGGTHQDGSGRLGGNDSSGLVEKPEGKARKEKPLKPTEFQTPYKKASKLPSLGTLVPKNMATAVKNAFAAFRKEHGDIDKFVAKELGYNEAELGDHFAAEQVDAIGLAIHNLQKDAGFIIGDQTGVGKGRVNAAIIRWAKRNGKVPVFITMNPQLYGDMVRDLQDIGMPGFNPLTTNVLTGSDAIDLPDGRKLRTKSGQKHKQLLQQVAREGLGEDYDAIFTTYNQLDSNGDNHRRTFMQAIAPRALFILDESHNAGASQNEQRKANDAAPSRAQFVRDLLKSSPNGVFYSSATYAKRPDVMDLYMKTDMRHAVNDGESLGEAITKGGIPMQQIVVAHLAEAGQYLRRERTWEGADVETHSVKTDTKRADACADAMRAIMEFDRAKQKALKKLKDKEAGGGFDIGDNKSANEGGMSSIGFSAIMHNLISQSILSQKVEAIVDACETAIKNGEKPVITLSNTMGSAIEEYANVNKLAFGDPINITFEDMFLRYLEKTRTIKKTEGSGKKKKTIEERLLTDEELGPVAVALYKRAGEIIRKSGVKMLPVSFIDMIEEGLRKKGISSGEITGRNVGIDYSGAVPVLAKKDNSTSEKINTVNSFNSGSLDAVILNSAGSTGISLHASERFKDQRRRTMIVAQPDGNIDVFMQTLGRIHRTGQVVAPKYQLLFTDIPAEKRHAAVLAKKMASLNANTSAAKDSDASFKNIPDFINKYGDRVAMRIMEDNPLLHEKMGAPLDKKENSRGGDSIEGAMQKLTGYIPLLPVAEQKQIYDELEAAYKDLTTQLEAMGALDLEAKPLPLDAKLVSEEEITPKKDIAGSQTPFTAAAKLGKYDVKKLGKPLPVEKVREMVAEGRAIDPRDDRPAFNKWLANKLKGISEKKRGDFERRAEANYETLKAIANTFKPGVPVTIENTSDGQKIVGIVTNVAKKGKAENPVALGNYHVEIAVADPAKKLVFAFSQIADSSNSNYRFETSDITREQVYKAIEDGQSDARETVYIATGNVLAAFERLEKGRVVVFEDHEGNLTPGLMLPKTSSISDILNGLDVALTPAQGMEFLEKCRAKEAMLKTEDKLCSITRSGNDSFDMAVPGSKAKGGQYFLNGAILAAAGKDFVKSGNSMALRGLSGEKMRAVLDAMAGQDTGFIADNNKDVAREVSGQKQISASSFNKKPGRKRDFADKPMSEMTDEELEEFLESGSLMQNGNEYIDNQGNVLDKNGNIIRPADKNPFGSITPGQFLPPRNASMKGRRAAAIRDTVDALNKNSKNAAETEVVQRFADLPAHIREKFAGKIIEAAYDPQTRKVWFVADNIGNATRAAEVWAHEQIVHNGLRGMLSEGERVRLLNRLWLKMGGMANPIIRERAKLYGLRPTANSKEIPILMEEVIAHLAETKRLGHLDTRQQSLWRNIVDAILRAWNKLVERITGRNGSMGFEQLDNLLTALGNYVINGENAFDLQADTVGAMASMGEGQEIQYKQVGKKESQYDIVLLPDGGIDFGFMQPHKLNDNTSLIGAPIRLLRGISSFGRGKGYMHIEDAHGDDIRKLGYPDARAFVWDLINNYNEIWAGERGSLLLVRNDASGKMAGFIQLEKEGDFYNVKSAFPVSGVYPQQKTRKLLWKRHSPASTATDGRNPFLPVFKNARLNGHVSIKSDETPQSQRGQSTGENINSNPNDGKSPLASIGKDISERAKSFMSKVNSYGVPMERVTVIEGNITQEELEKALEELSGRNLVNILEGLTAQVNSNQRTKLASAAARAKSMANGFTGNEHNVAASKIENAWKWAAEVPEMGGSKPEQRDVKIRRFFSGVSINGKDAFLELTIKDSSAGLRLYSAELLNEKELRVKLGDVDNNSSASPLRSFEEILDRLKGPVNNSNAPLASIGKDISERAKSFMSKVNSYGVPMERVTVIDKPFTREEAKEALKTIAGQNLPNLLEGITAQVNSKQRDKLTSGTAMGKSKDNGFTPEEHYNLASQIANAWKWAAEIGQSKDRKNRDNVSFSKYVAAIQVAGEDAFSLITAMNTAEGLKLYSVELIKEKELRLYADPGNYDSSGNPVRSSEMLKAMGDGDYNSPHHTLSIEEIIDRLKSPVNNSDAPLASIGKDISERAKSFMSKVNSYGVPMERVTVIDKPFTMEEALEVLEKLKDQDLPNILEGLTAQVNRRQREELVTGKRMGESKDNGFTEGEHYNLASQIANAWKWSAQVGRYEDQHKRKNVVIRRFVAPLRVEGQDVFAWLTIMETPQGLKLYAAKLLNEKQLRLTMDNKAYKSLDYPARSYEEIIDRLKSPVNNNDAPLASIGKDISERAKSFMSSDAIASGIRKLRKVAGRGVSEDVRDILSDPEMGKLVRKDDLSLWERFFKVPHFIAKDHKEAAGIYERQQRRAEERMAATNEDIAKMSILFDQDKKKSLNEKEYAELGAMIHKWDGKEIPELKNVAKFKVKGKYANGKSEYEINPEFREKFREWLKAQPGSARVKGAFLQVREALDDAFIKAYGRMAQMEGIDATELEKYRNEFGSIHNYFPHSRKGKYYVMATEGEGSDRKVVYRQHFDVPIGSSVREEWAKIVAAQRKNYPNAKWHNPGEVEKLPDDILGAPIDPQAMEQIIKTAAAKIGDKEQAAEVTKLMLQGVADVLKARGFGSHGIHRQNIAGYEKENIKEVLYDYFSGLNGWLTKMDAAADFTQMLGKIDARKKPRLWQYMSQYTKDMLRNSDSIDKAAARIKTIAFAWYLGANLKTAVVNSTQNIIDGVPRLQQYVKGGAGLWLKAAYDTIGMKYSGQGIERARNLTADEERMLERLYGNGIINAAYMEELQGQILNSPVARGWRKFVALLGKPMGMVECFNRASLALAAYRAARAGAWQGFAERELGVTAGQKMNAEQAERFAALIVRDSHFEYGKGNMPEIMRSTWAGRAFSPMYTFRSFGANQLNLWYRALTKEGIEGKIFVAKSLGATIALGGLASFPFFATLSALCTAIGGDDEDWQTKIKKQLPENDLVRDMVCYGIPAVSGFSIAGSLRMETPFTDSFRKGKTFKDAMQESIGGIIGIPFDLFVSRPDKFIEAKKYGQGVKMVESLAPTFVSNILTAWRLNTEGQTGKTGAPIIDKTKGQQNRLTTSEAIGKALGFQPVSSSRSFDDYRAAKLAESVRDDKINELVNLVMKTLEGKGPQYRSRAIQEIRAWNERIKGTDKKTISLKDVMRRVNRRRPKQGKVS